MEESNKVKVYNLKRYFLSNVHHQDEEFKHDLDVCFLMFVNAINVTTHVMDKEN